uniref:Uncharacterized protein n=1 Tax=Arundo donax TaxID=35708 RepID=A0A0A9F989_ARUDO
MLQRCVSQTYHSSKFCIALRQK